MSSWKALVKNIAPVLGTALGGPMAGTAVKMLANEFLGDSDKPPAELEKQLSQQLQSASPETLARLKELDNAFEMRMAELGVDVFALEVEDRKSAREHHDNSPMPAILVVLLTALVAAGTYLLMTVQVPEDNSSIVYMVFGQLMAVWAASCAYWVGTTRSSGIKNRMINPPTVKSR